MKCFTYAKTTAEAASNTYTDEQLVNFVLAGIHLSKQDVYRTSLQLYRLERLQRKSFTLREIERNLFQIDGAPHLPAPMVLVLLLVPLNATIQLHQHAVMRLLP